MLEPQQPFALTDYTVWHTYQQQLLKALHPEDYSPEWAAFYAEVSRWYWLTMDQVEQATQEVMALTNNRLGYSAAQRRVFTAMGYRNNSLAQEIRVNYSTQRKLETLVQPNLWHQLLLVPHVESVFYHSSGRYRLFHLELLFEPALRGIADYPHQALESNLHAMLQMLSDQAAQKTASLRHLRSMAYLLGDLECVNRTTSLDLMAVAMGYKAWSPMLAASHEDHVSNLRHPWSLSASPAAAVA